MKDTLGMKLPVGPVSAKTAMVLKKATGLSLAEIKAKAANDEFIVLCDYVDLKGLELINRLKREMASLGVEVRLFEDGIHERPSELFDNIEETHHSINEDYDGYDRC